jgi:WD40-like Beta Propeller Repeat
MSPRPLIPRRKLFGSRTFRGAKLSPDGRLISWLASADGVLNVWVSPVDNIAAGQPVTRTRGRPINWQAWSPDGRHIMFLNDLNGDENLHLFVVDPRNCELRDLTPFDKIRAMPTYWSHVTPDKIAVSLLPTCGQSAAWPRGPSSAISRSSAGSCTRCALAAPPTCARSAKMT